MERYDHTQVEKKWQKRWEESEAFRADDSSKKEKFYVLDMFPYPSGAGLHVGHVEGYTATDIYSRYKRLKGFNVLHPMGWDAFGLPAENYAIKTGIPPVKTTADAIDTFRAQIKLLGLSYDWSREIGTHTPEYYKWTQWFFLFLYNNGLAYKKKALVNWDPVDQTVLANEQVLPDGTAERSGAKVEKKDLAQWFFKITDFADALHDDLDTIDWPESTKQAQRNWIGRSEGAEIDFAIANSDKKIKVFTTRADTLFGATFLVLAPEHPLLSEMKLENGEEVLAYIHAAKNKSEIDRTNADKEKTGVELKGVRAINPANGEEIPMFVADYVLGGYGTGAIMAVPAHDERDGVFAKKYYIPTKQVIAPVYTLTGESTPQEGKQLSKRKVVSAILRNPKTDTYVVLKFPQKGICGFIGGGLEEGENEREAAAREITEETGYTDFTIHTNVFPIFYGYGYKPRKDINCFDYEYFVVADLNSETRQELHEEDKGAHEIIWAGKEEVEKLLTLTHHRQLWDNYHNNVSYYIGEGILINSGEFDGLTSDEAKEKITEFVGGRMVKTYRLRDWLISRQRYWGAPIPVVYDPEGNPHPIPEEHLPWMLPTDVEFKPTGTSPLGQSKELLERTEKIFGKGWTPEIDTMDTFVCSSWYYYRFADPRNETEFASKEAIKKWLPVDLYVGGAEHTVLHLLYARFFTKALQKFGYISFSEPFSKMRHQGIILAEDSRKMSKRWNNVINPDDVIEIYGADTLRMYEMFMGPLEAMKPWSSNNIIGVRRFLERVWKAAEKIGDVTMDSKTNTLLGQTIRKVGDDIEDLKFNTAISALMIFLNHLQTLPTIPKEAYVKMLQILSPFAPHMCSELFEQLGVQGEIDWPAYSDAVDTAASVTIAVQVNGKVRATIELAADAEKETALHEARINPEIAARLAQGKEVKAIYVPGKIINFVVV